MIDGSVLQSAQRCFEKKSRVVVKMVVSILKEFFGDNALTCGIEHSGLLSQSVGNQLYTRKKSKNTLVLTKLIP